MKCRAIVVTGWIHLGSEMTMIVMEDSELEISQDTSIKGDKDSKLIVHRATVDVRQVAVWVFTSLFSLITMMNRM